MLVTFLNVQVTVEAKDARHAYAKLCSALGSIAADWQTDTFTEDPDSLTGERSTAVLFPPDDEERNA